MRTEIFISSGAVFCLLQLPSFHTYLLCLFSGVCVFVEQPVTERWEQLMSRVNVDKTQRLPQFPPHQPLVFEY